MLIDLLESSKAIGLCPMGSLQILRCCLLKPSSNWSLFKIIISDQTLIKLK